MYNHEYQRQLDHIHSRDPDILFAGCKKLCSWLTDGDQDREPEKRKQPCPRPNCGGEDRFRFAPDLDRPSFFCNICEPTGGWDAIALVEEFADAGELKHAEAVRLLAEATGYGGEGTQIAERKQNEKPIPPLLTFDLKDSSSILKALHKHRPEIDFVTYE